VRIALVIEYFDPARGGVEVCADQLGRGLMDAGHEVHVFTNEWNPSLEGYVFHRVPKMPMKLFRRYAFARRASALVSEMSFDIVHGFGRSSSLDVFHAEGGVHRRWLELEPIAAGGAWKGALARLKRWLSPDNRLVLRLEAEQFRNDSTHLIAVSNMVRDEMQRFYSVPAERIHLVYNGVELDRFHPRNRERYRQAVRSELGLKDEVVLLFVGHNFKRKGLHAAIRALPLLDHGPALVRLLVLGAGKQKRYAKLLRKLDCEGHVIYAGASTVPERFYAAADIVLFPSYYDPFGNVVLEGLAAGLPVITSIYTGAGELVSPGKNGAVVDPDDAQALAAAIQSYLDPQVRDAAGRAARTAAESWGVSRYVEEILKTYDRVLVAKRARGEETGPRDQAVR